MRYLVFPVLVLCAASAMAQQSANDELAAVRARYQQSFTQLTATENAALAGTINTYTQELGRMKTTAQARGDLDAVVLLDPLIANAKQGRPEAPAANASPALRTAYASYERNRTSALLPTAARRQQMGSAYMRDIGMLEQRYTRLGQIEAAKLAREARGVIPGTETETSPT